MALVQPGMLYLVVPLLAFAEYQKRYVALHHFECGYLWKTRQGGLLHPHNIFVDE